MNVPEKNHPILQHRVLDPIAYEDLYRQCPLSSILQWAAYGEAKRLVEGFRVERVTITEAGNPVAVYQVLMKTLPLIGTVARINRGPLYLRNEPFAPHKLNRLYRSLYEEWIIKRECFLQIAPNITESLMTNGDFRELGFMCSDEPNWQSGWLRLDQSSKDLRKALQQKWRNLLNKSERIGMELHLVENEADMDVLLQEYERFMKERNFQSTSSHLIKAMYRQSPGKLYAATARKDGCYLGAVIIVKHGNTCTYLAGVTSNDGRKANANYLLLWNGIMNCMNEGFLWFDVGGIDEINTPGISHFKKGLNFTPYRLIGEFEGHQGLRYHLLSTFKSYYFRRCLRKKDAHAVHQEMPPEGG